MTVKQLKHQFDIQVKWCDLCVESALLQYQIDTSESYYGESANDSYVITEAAKKAAGKIATAIKNLFDKAINYVKGVVDKIKQASTKKKLDDIKKAQNDNPNLSKATIECEDFKSQDTAIKDYKKNIDKCHQKLNSGKKLSDGDKSALQKAKEFCKKHKDKITIGVFAAVGAAGGLLANEFLDVEKRRRNIMKSWEKKHDKVQQVDSTAEVLSNAGLYMDDEDIDFQKDLYDVAMAEADYMQMNALNNLRKANLINKIWFKLRLKNASKFDDYVEDNKKTADETREKFNAKHKSELSSPYSRDDVRKDYRFDDI